MVLSGLLRWVLGYVQVEAEGGFPERLLNRMTALGISPWGVRHREESLRFCCFAGDYRRLRAAARDASVRMRLRHKRGLPFWAFRYRYRCGLLAGLAVYAVVLMLLSSRIWVIDVVGASDATHEEILEVAADMGVQIGAPMKSVRIKDMEIDGLRRLPALSWVTVNPSGCVARVEVTEREPTPQVIDLTQPSDMIAVRDGKILSMEIRSGYRAVQNGEAVVAGTILITGRLQTELGEKLYRSYGEVWAETRRQITVSIPLVYQRWIETGFVAYRPTFTFLCWEFPLYSTGALSGAYAKRAEKHFLQAGDLTLPLGLTEEWYYRVKQEPTARTRVQATRLANRQLEEGEKTLFLPGKFEELERQERVKDGCYILTVTYSCVENIAVEQPIEIVGG